jgi:16S rRNA (guanine966-N2)-methyltransferase
MRIVAGRFRRRPLVSPPGREVRPTSDRARQAVFDILEVRAPGLEGRLVLDLFAGTGAMGLEALSRGAQRAVFVENATPALEAIRHNIGGLRLPPGQAQVLRADALRLGRAVEQFDLVFLDPPYQSGAALPVIAALRRGNWLRPGADLVAELAAGEIIATPPGMELVDERRYGAARFVFLHMGDEGEVGITTEARNGHGLAGATSRS